MKKSRLASLVAGGCLLALSVPAVASAADVNVRVEGASQTLVPTTTVSTAPGSFDPPGPPSSCSSTSIGGALQLATGGDFATDTSSLGPVLETVRGETYPVGDDYTGRFWSLTVGGEPTSTGLCDTELTDGADVVVYAACGGASDGCFAGGLLDVVAPATARPGQPFTVQVFEYTTTYGGPPDFAPSTSRTPVAGATVTAPGAPAATTGADGRATLTVAGRGIASVQATSGNSVREAVDVCLTDGADGFCGTSAPGASAPPRTPAGPDREAPQTRILGIEEGETFDEGDGPRELRGLAGVPRPTGPGKPWTIQPDPSGLLMVKMRLTRRDGDRCEYFSGNSERFRPNRKGGRCGAKHGYWFDFSKETPWTYLLPERLPRGRYVLDVKAIDRAYNRGDDRKRGQNRIVFHVE